jgi:hypothetical protein
MTVDLATGRYQSFDPAQGVPVRTTVGRPRFRLGYELKHEIRELAPVGLMNLDGAEFEAAYRARLDRLDLGALVERFEAISAAEGGQRVVLLCFEDVWAGQACHRRTFAAWFEEQPDGWSVPELEPGQKDNNRVGQLRLDLDQPAPIAQKESDR